MTKIYAFQYPFYEYFENSFIPGFYTTTRRLLNKRSRHKVKSYNGIVTFLCYTHQPKLNLLDHMKLEELCFRRRKPSIYTGYNVAFLLRD